MYQVPQKLRPAIEKLAQEAHEEELRLALAKLQDQFRLLDQGEISPFDLQKLVYQFDRVTVRDLQKKYTSPMLDVAVAHAVYTGILDRKRVESDVLDYITGLLEFYKANEEQIEGENN